MEGFGPATYGDRFASVYDDWYRSALDTEGAVERIIDLAGGGAVLELGVGTGRLAIPLAERGLPVVGVDASPEMLRRLRAKPGGSRVRVVEGDLARLAELAEQEDLGGPFAVAVCSFNTLFNLADERAQQACLRAARDLLAPGGRLVVEAFVPDPDPEEPVATSVEPTAIEADRVVLRVARVDHRDQTVTGQHVAITEAGIHLYPWHVRYVTPDQLDAMAAAAGLDRVARWSGWHRQPFTAQSTTHVTVYRRSDR